MRGIPHIKKHSHKLHGFTLVELIVVITLLAILGTIAFLSLQGYSRSARDSVRIENLTSIKKGLDMFQVVSSTYPLPEGYITLTASGTPIGYQGFIKEQGESIAKISPGGSRDPLDSNIYTTYSVNTSKTRMQLMSFLEDGGNVSAFVPNNLSPSLLSRSSLLSFPPSPLISSSSLISTSFASSTSDYTLRTPLTKGDSLGILLSSSTGTLNQPVQENYSVSSFTGVDVVNTSSGYMVVFGKQKSLNGTGSSLITAFTLQRPDGKDISKYDTSLVGYWDMETTTQSGGQVLLKDLSGYGNNGTTGGGVIIGGVTTRNTGKAMNFDGIDDHVDIIDHNSLDLTSPQFTFSTWFYANDYGLSGRGTLISKPAYDIGGGVYNYVLRIANPGDPRLSSQFQADGDWTHGDTPNSNTISNFLNNWHQVILVRNTTSFKMYIDGVLSQQSTALYSSYVNGSYPLTIGAVNSSSTYDFSGSLDEVRIYKRALSDSEIQSLYNAIK